MNINRHNYEEYFILYMDNELSDAQRRMVKDFTEKNPDLKEELDILLQSRLIPNQNIVFEGKNELYRSSEISEITADNYEEYMLLYIDNELNSEQKLEVEKFIESSSQAKQELGILQKTKLQTEAISFPYKESLYRKAERVRVVSIKWWRIAAAAVILLAIGLTAVVLINNDKPDITDPGIVKTNPKQAIKDADEKTDQNTDPKIEQDHSDKKDENKVNTILQPEKNIAKTNDNKIKEEPVGDQNMIANINQKEFNPLPVEENIRPKNLNNLKDVIETQNTLTTQNIPQFAVTNNLDKPYIMIADPTDNTEESKNKFRGFFRKATRFVERTTNISATDDDERLLIGGFAVKLK